MSQSRRYSGKSTAWPVRWATFGLLVLLLVACSGSNTPATNAPSAPSAASESPTGTTPAPVAEPTATQEVPATATRAAATATPRPTATATATRRPTTIPTGPTPTAITLSNPSKLTQVGLKGESIAQLAVGGSQGTALFSGGKGVFRSLDGGKTWKAVRSEVEAPKVSSLVVAPSNPLVVYVGVSDGCTKATKQPGYVSQDGGETWRAIGDNLRSIVVDPKSPQRVYAIDCEGLKLSVNGGSTWQPIEGQPIPVNTLAYLAISPAAPEFIYLVVATEASKLMVTHSVDRGETWQEITPKIGPGLKVGQVLPGAAGNIGTGRPQSLAVDADNPAIVLLSTTYGIIRSEDGGATWKLVDTGLENTLTDTSSSGARLTSALVSDPDRTGMYWVGTGYDKLKGVGLFRTRDSGATWRKPITGLEGKRINELVLAGPPHSRTLYIATDDGIWSLTAP